MDTTLDPVAPFLTAYLTNGETTTNDDDELGLGKAGKVGICLLIGALLLGTC